MLGELSLMVEHGGVLPPDIPKKILIDVLLPEDLSVESINLEFFRVFVYQLPVRKTILLEVIRVHVGLHMVSHQA